MPILGLPEYRLHLHQSLLAKGKLFLDELESTRFTFAGKPPTFLRKYTRPAISDFLSHPWRACFDDQINDRMNGRISSLSDVNSRIQIRINTFIRFYDAFTAQLTS